jgi:hypothetical protein
VHEEAVHAGELVILLRLDLDSELFVRQVGTGKLERFGGLGLVLVDLAGVLVVAASLELLDALFGLFVLVLAWCVVVSRHDGSPLPLTGRLPHWSCGAARQIVHHRDRFAIPGWMRVARTANCC